MKVGVLNPDGAPGWNIVRPNGRIWIYLDERKVERPVAADDVAGAVWVHKRLPNGEYCFNEDRTELVLEKLTGKVEIKLLEDRRHECA